MRLRTTILSAALGAGLLLGASQASAAGSYTLFESDQPRPLALSPSGRLLFATNTPNNRLEVFAVTRFGLVHTASIPVGLEPVAVAARNDREVWVVNHLSDSVSVVDLDLLGGQVVRTLLVGDEPRDIVFAGARHDRAFITTAHRGQNTHRDPQLTTPSVGRADVWVFDADHLGATLEGEPVDVLSLFTDTPRALEASPDGSLVYAAGFQTGNRTTALVDTIVPDGFGPDGVPGPATNFQGIPAPEVGIIVKYDGAHWKDFLGRPWDEGVKFNLPDKDVFVIDALASPPRPVQGRDGYFRGVGTILYNIAVNPVTGRVYVSNTDAQNHLRFEGPGIFAGDALKGRLHLNRISVLSEAGVFPRHLNKHIDYTKPSGPVPNAESETSLSQPTGMAITRDGRTLYVAALGSDQVGVFDTRALEDDTFVPDRARQIEVPGGPTGLALDERQGRLFVLTRFDNAIKIIDTRARVEIGRVPLYNPEPPTVTRGRRFLYDARHTSGHGDQSCASCHVSGDTDGLAWDLGNPDGEVTHNPGPFATIINPLTGQPVDASFHPMKGPLLTTSLRGMANHGPMHWRGDRTGGNDAPTSQPGTGSFDEKAAFIKFQAAFTGLLMRDSTIPEEDMAAFADYALELTYPPNPIRALDNSLTPEQAAGQHEFYTHQAIDGFSTCVGCHKTDKTANQATTDKPGFFGTDGSQSFEFQPQVFKIPHLRGLYQNVGMFGMPEAGFIYPGDNDFKGDQVRGFGYTHSGAFDSMFRFFHAGNFIQSPVNPHALPVTPEGETVRRQLEAFMLVFDSNLAPIVGQQVTITARNHDVVAERVALLEKSAEDHACDLVAKTRRGLRTAGYLYIGGGRYLTDRPSAPSVTLTEIERGVLGVRAPVTLTCVPPGSGYRIGIDQDDDGVLDGVDMRLGATR
jgi:DNA-binding beta-propeller fold protein YncE